jgi:hypothetical protein
MTHMTPHRSAGAHERNNVNGATSRASVRASDAGHHTTLLDRQEASSIGSRAMGDGATGRSRRGQPACPGAPPHLLGMDARGAGAVSARVSRPFRAPGPPPALRCRSDLNYGWPAAPPSSTRRFMFNALAEPSREHQYPARPAPPSFQNRSLCMHAHRSWLVRASRVLEGGAMSNPTPDPRAPYPPGGVHVALVFTCRRGNSRLGRANRVLLAFSTTSARATCFARAYAMGPCSSGSYHPSIIILL